MLCEMHIRNFALMEEVQLSFSSGLTVLSGETGAGKSMLIDALGVLLGDRAASDFIRYGLEKAMVEGVFEELPSNIIERLTEAGYTVEDDQLFLSREINRNGRNVCRIQGRTVPLSLYRELAQGLVDIHGQMEHQSLFDADTHRGLLDAFGGEEHLSLLEEVNKAASRYLSFVRQERKLLESELDREHREDLLRYQIEEISNIDPQPDEMDQLAIEKKRLGNAEKLITLSTQLYRILYAGSEQSSSVLDLLGHSKKLLQELARFDEGSSNELLEPLESTYYIIEDLADQVNSYTEQLDFEPGRLDQIEERLIELQRLKKYGQSVEEILKAKEEMEAELLKMTNIQDEIKRVRLDKEKSLESYLKKASKLTEARTTQSKRLEEGLGREFADLGLEKAKFEVIFTSVSEPKTGGAEEIEFYFSANPGEPTKPLAKVASGGEMSRLTLAMKSLLAQIESVGTFIFDEVDSGVGGRTILKVGDKLSRIAEEKQVFCITHSAQIAAFGDHHYGIEKVVNNNRTYSEVTLLSEEDRIRELARMLGGDEADITLEHAVTLRKNIQNKAHRN